MNTDRCSTAKDNFRISLNVMTLKVTSNSVNSVQGVPISVTGIAQVEGEKNVELQGEMDAGWTYTEHTCTDSINEEKNSPQENNKSNRNCLYLSPLPAPFDTYRACSDASDAKKASVSASDRPFFCSRR